MFTQKKKRSCKIILKNNHFHSYKLGITKDNTGQSILFCAIYIHETSNFRLS